MVCKQFDYFLNNALEIAHTPKETFPKLQDIMPQFLDEHQIPVGETSYVTPS